jgi:NAD(P)-dependent dehydrogenase (short-subunit alcohol dehydrogenase family)
MECTMTIQDFSNTPLDKLISLEGRAAVVTGGARGIGLAIAKRLSEAGADIVIADKDENGCMQNALKSLQHNGISAIGLKHDARDKEAMNHAAEQAIHQFGHLDIWVNDAGIYPMSPFLKLKDEVLDDVIDTNIKGVMYGSRAAATHMPKKGGVILNLASVAGFTGDEEMVHYNASKFAVRGITASLAKELGEKNIRVVAIAPTLIETPGTHEEIDNFKKEAKETVEEIPLGRIGQPDDVARAALFLVSDLAAFVSGTTLVVDGGNLALG